MRHFYIMYMWLIESHYFCFTIYLHNGVSGDLPHSVIIYAVFSFAFVIFIIRYTLVYGLLWIFYNALYIYICFLVIGSPLTLFIWFYCLVWQNNPHLVKMLCFMRMSSLLILTKLWFAFAIFIFLSTDTSYLSDDWLLTLLLTLPLSLTLLHLLLLCQYIDRLGITHSHGSARVF